MTTEDVAIPCAYLGAFAADAAGNWSVGNRPGVVYDSASVLGNKGALSCGLPLVVTGGTGGLAALGTDGGGTIAFQVGAAGVTWTGSVPYKGSRVQVSDDGQVLAVQYDADAQYFPDFSLRVFSMPSGTLIHAWPLQYNAATDTWYKGISLARGGTEIAQVVGSFSGNWTYQRLVTDLTGSTPSLMDQGNPPLALSPDGTLAAGVDSTLAATQVFKNGALVDAASGTPGGFIDNDRIFLQLGSGSVVHTVSTSMTGPQLPLGCTQAGFSVIDGNHVFCEAQKAGPTWTNTIHDLTTGAAVWTGSNGDHGLGATAAGYVVYLNDHHVYTEAYTIPP